jgi:hypothetical protein
MGRFLFVLVLLAQALHLMRLSRKAAFIRCAYAFGFSIAVPKRIFGWLRPWPLPRSRDTKV